MKTYTVLFAEDVPHYGTVEIEAADDSAALAAAMAFDHSGITNDPLWESTTCKRIVSIADPDGNYIAEDISLDGCFLRYGGEQERLLCDAAPQLLKALGTTKRAVEKALDIMHYEDRLPVTALDGWEIERVFDTLSDALIDVTRAVEATADANAQHDRYLGYDPAHLNDLHGFELWQDSVAEAVGLDIFEDSWAYGEEAPKLQMVLNRIEYLWHCRKELELRERGGNTAPVTETG